MLALCTRTPSPVNAKCPVNAASARRATARRARHTRHRGDHTTPAAPGDTGTEVGPTLPSAGDEVGAHPHPACPPRDGSAGTSVYAAEPIGQVAPMVFDAADRAPKPSEPKANTPSAKRPRPAECFSQANEASEAPEAGSTVTKQATPTLSSSEAPLSGSRSQPRNGLPLIAHRSEARQNPTRSTANRPRPPRSSPRTNGSTTPRTFRHGPRRCEARRYPPPSTAKRPHTRRNHPRNEPSARQHPKFDTSHTETLPMRSEARQKPKRPAAKPSRRKPPTSGRPSNPQHPTAHTRHTRNSPMRSEAKPTRPAAKRLHPAATTHEVDSPAPPNTPSPTHATSETHQRGARRKVNVPSGEASPSGWESPAKRKVQKHQPQRFSARARRSALEAHGRRPSLEG